MRFFCARCRASCEDRLVVCPSCGQWDNFIPDVTLGLREPAPVQVLTARQLGARRVSLAAVWSLGQVPVRPPMLIACWGPPGAGKSTYVLKLASDLCRQGHRVLLVSAEEGFAETVSQRLRRLEISDEAILVVPNVNYPSAEAAALERECDCLFLDSWSVAHWAAADLDRARDRFFSLVTLHATKEGEAAGPNAILHVADVVVEVDTLKAKVTKSRWTGAMETEVIECMKP